MHRLLVIEDHLKLVRLLEQGLVEAGYEVVAVTTLTQGLEEWRRFEPHLILLDAGLPDGDGIQALVSLREEDPDTLVILLTARDAEKDRVLGFEHGADDYVVKPFSFPELLARIQRHLARAGRAARDTEQTYGDWKVDPKRQTLMYGEHSCELTPRELRIFTLLLDAKGGLVPRSDLYNEVWPGVVQNMSLQNTLEVHLSHLRNKAKSLCGGSPIQTVRGKGYCLGEGE